MNKGTRLKHQPKLKPRDAIGRTIVCKDGIPRKIYSIAESYQYPDHFIVNENDPDSKMGYFVHALSLVAQVMGYKVPDKEQCDAASRLWKKMRTMSVSEDNAGQIIDRAARKIEFE